MCVCMMRFAPRAQVRCKRPALTVSGLSMCMCVAVAQHWCYPASMLEWLPVSPPFAVEDRDAASDASAQSRQVRMWRVSLP
jgi:hypothetical protein